MTEDEAIMERMNKGKPDFSGLEQVKPPYQPPPMQRMTFEELSERNIPEPKYLIEGIIREAGAALVFGPPGIGKSWVTSTCAFMAAHGRGLTLVDGLKAGDHEGVKSLYMMEKWSNLISRNEMPGCVTFFVWEIGLQRPGGIYIAI